MFIGEDVRYSAFQLYPAYKITFIRDRKWCHIRGIVSPPLNDLEHDIVSCTLPCVRHVTLCRARDLVLST